MQRWLLSLLIATASGATFSQELPEDRQSIVPVSYGTSGSADATDSSAKRVLSSVRSAVAGQSAQVADHTSELISTAVGFLGLRYRRGGNSEETGFDCSGFVRAVYQKTAGLVLPRRAKDQAESTAVIDRQDLQPGDLVFFNTMRRAFSHVGVYLGDGKFIHSPRTGQEVRVDSLQAKYWKHRFDGARRVELNDATTERMTLASVSVSSSR